MPVSKAVLTVFSARDWMFAVGALCVIGCASGSDSATITTDGSIAPGALPPAGVVDAMGLPPPAGSPSATGAAAAADMPGLGGTAGAPAPAEPTVGAAGAGAAEPVVGGAGMGGLDGQPPPSAPTGDAMIRGPEPTAASAMVAGPYKVVSTPMGLRNPAEYGTQTLHYPTGADAPFASIAIVPGFVSPEDSIKPWGPFLASHGIVVLTIGTNSGADSPEIRSTALLAALDTLKAENMRSGSPIEGQLDTSRMAVGGWSMGGGGTLLTASAHPELKAVIAICPWYLSAPFTKITVPTLMFAGTADVLAGGMSQTFYKAIPAGTPKTIFEIAGADHFYANAPTGAVSQVGRYGLSWLKVFLEGDERYKQFLTQSPTGASDFRTTVQ